MDCLCPTHLPSDNYLGLSPWEGLYVKPSRVGSASLASLLAVALTLPIPSDPVSLLCLAYSASGWGLPNPVPQHP